MVDTVEHETPTQVPRAADRSWRVPLAVGVVAALLLGLAGWVGRAGRADRPDRTPAAASATPSEPPRSISPGHARIYRVYEEVPADGELIDDYTSGPATCQVECPSVSRYYLFSGDPMAVYNQMKARFTAAGWEPAPYNCDCPAVQKPTYGTAFRGDPLPGIAGAWCKEDFYADIVVFTTGQPRLEYHVQSSGPVPVGDPSAC